MSRIHWLKRLVCFVFMQTVFFQIGEAGASKDGKEVFSSLKPAGVPARTLVNVGMLSYWVYSDGISAHNPNTDGSGCIFPKFTYDAGVIYSDGIIWAGFVHDGLDPKLRSGGTEYRTSLQPGAVLSLGVAEDPEAADVRIWRIRKDFADADLSSDAAELVDGLPEDMTEADIDPVRDQYRKDWQAWPWQKGAPFYDANGDGVYTPQFESNGRPVLYPNADEPGLTGADQVVWYVANDLDENRTQNFSGCPPMGMEMQVTLWAYNRSNELGHVVFRRNRFIYKGTATTPDSAHIDSMFVSQFSDPDLGAYGDDFVGCDTDLDMMFVYNSSSQNQNFMPYNYMPPAAGYVFLQGPLKKTDSSWDEAVFNMKKRKGYKNLGMTAFNYFTPGNLDMEFLYEVPEQQYNLMNGLTPRGGVSFRMNDCVTPTLFPLSGNPVTGEGDLDGVILPASERRGWMHSGPWSMALGDTQEVVIGVVAGLGHNHLASISVMKHHTRVVREYADLMYQLPPEPPTPNISATEMDQKIILYWGGDLPDPRLLEQWEQSEYRFEGYNVYQIPYAGCQDKELWIRLATYDLVNDQTVITGYNFNDELGLILDEPLQFGSNSGIRRIMVIESDTLNDSKPLVNGRTYHFAVTCYNVHPDPKRIIRTVESDPAIVMVVPHTPDPGIRYFHEQGEALEVTHEGAAIAFVDVTVFDPTQTTGHDYKVWFNQQYYYCDALGMWNMTSYADSVGKFSKPTDLTGSSLSAAAVYSTTAGKINLNFYLDVVSPDYDYCDGVELTFPAGITVNSASSADVDYAIDGNTVTFGYNDLSEDGPFSGGQMVSVNVDGFTPPLTVDYTMFDDGWATGYGEPYASSGDGVVDAEGSATITKIGNEFISINHWNLWDIDAAENVLEDQTILNGINTERVENGIYYPGGEEVGLYDVKVGDALVDFVDALQISVDCGYAAQCDDFSSYSTDGDGAFDITSYGIQGWSGGEGTARSIDAYGFGATELDLLQRDYELRFTGEYDTPITVGAMTYHSIKEGTGSLAVLYGARGYTLDAHPSPNNPGDGSAFFVRIPFEVWDMEAEDGPRQVAIIIYDRKQDYSAGGDMYAFNPADRMYCEFLMVPYADFIAADADAYLESDLLTWNTVWWTADWVQGEVLTFVYSNPIQLGIDEFTFSTLAPTYSDATAKEDVKAITVYPNPYYGYYDEGDPVYGQFITFSHLPQKVKMRIFDLAGNWVHTLEKDDASQFLRWDLRNHAGKLTASGL